MASNKSKKMETHFAPAERLELMELHHQIRMVNESPITIGVLKIVKGLIAVLNEQRQVLALNKELLQAFGITDPKKVLGLRPGEVVDCIHAKDMPGGCGTSEYCSTCGAVISIVISLAKQEPVEKTCTLQIEKNGKTEDLFLSVRSVPIEIKNQNFILLFLQDISLQQHWASLERVFYHDLKNLISSLLGTSELLSLDSSESTRDIATDLLKISERLAKEVEIQSFLAQDKAHYFEPNFQKISLEDIVTDLNELFKKHPLTKNRRFHLAAPPADTKITTDISLLNRVLGNMVINALEASGDGEQIEFWMEKSGEYVKFCVWNRAAIPPHFEKRIFQRNFSTKEKMGRGLGTYSMKIFGEKFLGGKVGFTTSMEKGTVFYLTLKI